MSKSGTENRLPPKHFQKKKKNNRNNKLKRSCTNLWKLELHQQNWWQHQRHTADPNLGESPARLSTKVFVDALISGTWRVRENVKLEHMGWGWLCLYKIPVQKYHKRKYIKQSYTCFHVVIAPIVSEERKQWSENFRKRISVCLSFIFEF